MVGTLFYSIFLSDKSAPIKMNGALVINPSLYIGLNDSHPATRQIMPF